MLNLIILILVVTSSWQVHAQGELCGIHFPTVGPYSVVSGEEFRAMKTKATPENSFVPHYNSYHRFFIDTQNLSDFIVLKYINKNFEDSLSYSTFQNEEFKAISTSYAGLLESITNEEIKSATPGFIVRYNLKDTPQLFTLFRYYFVGSDCALVTISRNTTSQPDLQKNLELIIASHLSFLAKTAIKKPANSLNFFELFVALLINFGILVAIYFPFRKFFFNPEKSENFGKYLIFRRVFARMFDGYLVLYFFKFVDSVFKNELLIEAQLSTQINYTVLVGALAAGSMYMIKKFGQTPGKFMLNLKVVQAGSDSLLSFKQVIMRDFPTLILWLAGASFALVNPEFFLPGRQVIQAPYGLSFLFFLATYFIYFVFSFVELIIALMRSDQRTLRDLWAQARVVDVDSCSKAPEAA